jgi:hypothetical protein
MKKIIYVVRTDMSFLNMLGKFGCMNWKVALRKEISALSVLEVWFVLFILSTEYVALHSSFGVRVLYSQSGPWYTCNEVFTMQKFHKKCYEPNSTIQLK